MFDTHTHLNADQLYPDRKVYLDTFVGQGGTGVVNIGIDPIANQRAIDIAQQSLRLFPGIIVKAAIGIHPCEVVDRYYTKDSVPWIQDHIGGLLQQHHDHIVAIGEAGVDLHYPESAQTLENQQYILDAQCQIALEQGLPLVIHSRDAYAETMDVLIQYPTLRLVMHCRGYTPIEVVDCQNRLPLCRIGYTGTVTYPKATAIRESLLVTPLDRILLETDAPYLAPQAVRGSVNQPAYLSHTYTFVSQLLHQDQEITTNLIRDNVSAFYSV